MSALRTSIALATCQGARFLAQQLESYVQQTRAPDEVVISDDRSSDGTAAIVNRFARAAPFAVTFIPNALAPGISRNFENAVLHCGNEIILLSDQDDFWLPNHVERLAGALESNERIQCVTSNSEVVDDGLRRLGYTLEESELYPRKLRDAVMGCPRNQFELVIRHRILAGHGMAFRRDLVSFLAPFSERCFPDSWIYLLAAAIGPVAYIPEPLTLYRTHTTQTKGGKKKSLVAVAQEVKGLPAFVDDAPWWKEILERLRAFPHLTSDFSYSERVLEEKIEFIERRTRNRGAGLWSRAWGTSLELIRGRYHRLGRGFMSYGRDLYGHR